MLTESGKYFLFNLGILYFFIISSIPEAPLFLIGDTMSLVRTSGRSCNNPEERNYSQLFCHNHPNSPPVQK